MDAYLIFYGQILQNCFHHLPIGFCRRPAHRFNVIVAEYIKLTRTLTGTTLLFVHSFPPRPHQPSQPVATL